MRRFSPNFGFLGSLCLLTFVISASFAVAGSESTLPAVPKLISFEEEVLFSPNAQYQTQTSSAGQQIQLDSGRLYLQPKNKRYQISSAMGQLQTEGGEFFIDVAPGKFTVAVEKGQALLASRDEKGKRLSSGQLAQLAEPYFGDDAPIESLGMAEGVDDPIRTLAFAEPGTILTTLALSEAAVGSSILLPILGGAAAAGGVAGIVTNLLDAEEQEDTPLPISQ